jgi:hypothetical protein
VPSLLRPSANRYCAAFVDQLPNFVVLILGHETSTAHLACPAYLLKDTFRAARVVVGVAVSDAMCAWVSIHVWVASVLMTRPAKSTSVVVRVLPLGC